MNLKRIVKFTSVIAIIIVFICGCSILTKNNSGGKSKTVMYKYLSDENSVKYYRTADKLSEYLVLNEDSTFIYENHKDTFFDFVYGTYTFSTDNQLFLFVDTVKSKSFLNTYRDSTIWNYRFTPSSVENLSFKIKTDSLVIKNTINDSDQKVLKVKK